MTKNIGNTRRLASGLLLCIFICLMPVKAWAELIASLTPNPATLDDIIQLTLSIDTTDDFSTPEPVRDLSPDFEIRSGPSVRKSRQFINGKRSGRIDWHYQLKAQQTGTLEIPAFKTKNRNSIFISQPISLTIKTGSSITPNNQWAFVEANVDKTQAYVQEQIVLTVNFFTRGDMDVTPEFPDLEKNFLSVNVTNQARKYQTNRNGNRYQVNAFKILLYPKTSEVTQIPPIRLVGRVILSRGSFFGQGRFKTIDVGSEPIAIRVLEPSKQLLEQGPWLPAESIGISETFEPALNQTLKVGEPITRTVTLKIRGQVKDHIKDLNYQDTPGLNIYPDQRQMSDTFIPGKGSESTLIQTMVLIPEYPGKYKINAIEVPWFDTRTQQIQIARTDSWDIEVAASGLDIPTSIQDGTQENQNINETSTNESDQTPPNISATKHLSAWLWVAATLIFLSLWVFTGIAFFIYRQGVRQTQIKALDCDKAQARNTQKNSAEKEAVAFEALLGAIKNNPINSNAWVSPIVQWASCLHQRDIHNLKQVADLTHNNSFKQTLSHIEQINYANPTASAADKSKPISVKAFIDSLEEERKQATLTQTTPNTQVTDKALASLSPRNRI